MKEKIKKIVVAKAVKAAEKDVIPPENGDVLTEKEAGTKEVGTFEGEILPKGEAAEELPKGPFVKPELKFLQNDEGKAFIGRKKSVFQKYGDEDALFIGRVGEKDLAIIIRSLRLEINELKGQFGISQISNKTLFSSVLV